MIIWWNTGYSEASVEFILSAEWIPIVISTTYLKEWCCKAFWMTFKNVASCSTTQAFVRIVCHQAQERRLGKASDTKYPLNRKSLLSEIEPVREFGKGRMTDKILNCTGTFHSVHGVIKYLSNRWMSVVSKAS